MGDLYPTKTRLALLRDVADYQVYRDRAGQSFYKTWSNKVTARMAELAAAGWVEADTYNGQWYLTDAGRGVLDAHGGAA